MPDEILTFVPEDVIGSLKTKRVQFVCWHKIAEYDNAYTIRYDVASRLFVVHIESSVWDGRGHEVSDELYDEITLMTQLSAILNEGQIMSLGFHNLD